MQYHEYCCVICLGGVGAKVARGVTKAILRKRRDSQQGGNLDGSMCTKCQSYRQQCQSMVLSLGWRHPGLSDTAGISFEFRQ